MPLAPSQHSKSCAKKVDKQQQQRQRQRQQQQQPQQHFNILPLVRFYAKLRVMRVFTSQ